VKRQGSLYSQPTDNAKLRIGEFLFDQPPEFGQVEFQLRTYRGNVAIVLLRLNLELAVSVDEEINLPFDWIDDPILGHAVLGVDIEFVDAITAGIAGRENF